MEYYGIDNVRGGIYSDEILPDYLKQSLELELSNSFSDYKDKIKIFDNIRNNPNLSINDFINQKNSYLELVNMGYYDITRDFISELEWLENKILLDSDSKNSSVRGKLQISKELNTRYKNLLDKMDLVRTKYFQLDTDSNNQRVKLEEDTIIKHPNFVFDFFIYHRSLNKDWEKEKNIAANLIKNYEFMGYTLINILECMAYDYYNPTSIIYE
jgi:hypothetical protein